MTREKILNQGFVVCASVAGANLFNYLVDQKLWMEAALTEFCNYDALTAESYSLPRNEGESLPVTLSVTDDGRIMLVSADGQLNDFTACLAAGINDGRLAVSVL